MVKNNWILNYKSNVNSAYRLFCLPYAGASAAIYMNWQNYIGDYIEICPIQLPGRENRRNEPLISKTEILTEMIYEGIRNYLDKPFSIFGHSMGGILAYELAIKIFQKEKKLSDIVFMSGTALNMQRALDISKLNDNKLSRYLYQIGGTKYQDLDNEKFRNNYFPIIRNDYKLLETYQCSYLKLPCKIRAFASKYDIQVKYKDTETLKYYTDDFRIEYFEGNHFFINSSQLIVCKKVLKELQPLLNNYDRRVMSYETCEK